MSLTKEEQLRLVFKKILNKMVSEIYKELHVKSYCDTDKPTEELLYEVKIRTKL